MGTSKFSGINQCSDMVPSHYLYNYENSKEKYKCQTIVRNFSMKLFQIREKIFGCQVME